MKILIILLFLPFYSFSQNFMMKMNVQETKDDSTIYYCNVKVIWGMKDNKICFLWEERYPLCFERQKHASIRSKEVRKKIEKFIKESGLQEDSKNIVLRDLFSSQWGELFLITIYVNEGMIIFVNRVDGKYPHYYFEMIKI